MTEVPPYDALPAFDGLDVRHAWEVWEPGDRLGTLNHLTDDVCLHALSLPATGRRVNLSLPLTLPDPPLYRRPRVRHRAFERNRNMVEDLLESLDPQASSQWDSLRHIKAREFGFYGGIPDWDAPAARGLGVQTLVERGLVGRGVLLDLPSYWLSAGVEVDAFSERPISVPELLDAASRQGVAFEAGDLLLVRTGWLRRYLADGGVPDGHLDMPTCVGLAAGADMAQFLWDNRFAAVAADNPAVEFLPGDPRTGSLHRRLIPALGMPLGELWDLEELSAACATTGRYEFCVVSVPLHVPGGVASPANAVAIL